MNINGKRICNNCFCSIKSEPCPECGYKRSVYRPEVGILPVGTMLKNRYSVGRVLGKGGFGVTYKAYDVTENRIIAVKEYYPSGLVHRDTGTTQITVSSSQYEENFKTGADKFFEEAKMISRFNGNPYIVNVYEFFYENGTVYFAMEYLDGVDLKHYMKEGGKKLSQGKVLFIANVITDALLIAHSMNVLHRDISPDNIFILKNGDVKLIDFGAARQVLAEQSKSLSVILKQGFAPIEQYQRRGKQGPWTDIYALGATLYYVLTGKLPDEVTERLDYPDIGSAEEFGVDEDFWEIIRKCMEVKAVDRYQSIFELKDKLNKLDIKPVPLTEGDESQGNAAAGVVIPETVAVQSNAMPETVAAQSNAMPETVAVQSDAMPETVAVQSDAMPETVAVQSNAMPETVAVQSDAMPETVAVQPDAIPETVAVQPDAISETVAVQTDGDTETKKKKNGLLAFLSKTNGKIIAAAAAFIIIAAAVTLAVLLSSKSGRGSGKGDNVAVNATDKSGGENTDSFSNDIETTGASGQKVTEAKTEANTVATKPAPTQSAETKPAPTKPAETKPAETKPAPTQPAPTKPAETKPAPTQPAETKPAPTQPAETKPAPTQPAPTQPAIQTVKDQPYSITVKKEGGNCPLTGTYTGEWKDGKPNGKGTFINSYQAGDYEYFLLGGDWKDGKLDGYCWLVDVCCWDGGKPDFNTSEWTSVDWGLIIVGEWKNNAPNGTVTEYECSGASEGVEGYKWTGVMKDGEWISDVPDFMDRDRWNNILKLDWYYVPQIK